MVPAAAGLAGVVAQQSVDERPDIGHSVQIGDVEIINTDRHGRFLKIDATQESPADLAMDVQRFLAGRGFHASVWGGSPYIAIDNSLAFGFSQWGGHNYVSAMTTEYFRGTTNIRRVSPAGLMQQYADYRAKKGR